MSTKPLKEEPTPAALLREAGAATRAEGRRLMSQRLFQDLAKLSRLEAWRLRLVEEEAAS